MPDALTRAVVAAREDLVRPLLEKERSPNYEKLLEHALKLKRLCMAQLLIDDAEKRSTNGQHIFHIATRIAVKTKNSMMLHCIAKHYRDIYTPDSYSLYAAITMGDTHAVRTLLRNSTYNASAISSAVVNAAGHGNITIFKLLESHPNANMSSIGGEALRSAASGGHTQLVRHLMRNPKVDPSADNSAAFTSAAFNGHLDVLKLLIKDPRVNPSANNNEALKWSVLDDRIEIVKFLLTLPKMDASFPANQHFAHACRKGNMRMVKLLGERPEVDLNRPGDTPIKNAAMLNHRKVVRYLVENVPYLDPKKFSNPIIKEEITRYVATKRTEVLVEMGAHQAQLPWEIIRKITKYVY